MGNVLRSKGDYNGAIELNKNALEMDSTNIDASYNLSLCYLFIKDYEKAWEFPVSYTHLTLPTTHDV